MINVIKSASTGKLRLHEDVKLPIDELIKKL